MIDTLSLGDLWSGELRQYFISQAFHGLFRIRLVETQIQCYMVHADLLRRSTRKVALSLEGAEFLSYAREILAQEDAAHAALGRGDASATA